MRTWSIRTGSIIRSSLCALLALSSGLWAPERAWGANINVHTPAESALLLDTVQTAASEEALVPTYSTFLELSAQPLRDQQTDKILVPWASQLHLHMLLPVNKSMELELELPVLLYQATQFPDEFGKVANSGLGDMRMGLTWPLLSRLPRAEGYFDLHMMATLPLGSAQSFRGSEQVSPGLGLRTGRALPKGLLTASLQYQHRPATEYVGSLGIRDSYHVRFSYLFLAPKEMTAVVELRGMVIPDLDPLQKGTAGLELMLGATRPIARGLKAQAALGLELGDSPLLPTARLWLGLSRSPLLLLPKDDDQDGLFNSADRCPNLAEDLDAFQDNDGCPDEDNDGDLILDNQDACPNEAGTQNGCPVRDRDGDGRMDDQDRCPEQAEDLDGHQDDDGCPDPDNDGDGLLDVTDRCPLQKEDLDRYQDSDGCPEDDNDGDGLKDLDDQCPDEPETLNGLQDGDGCPDAGRQETAGPAIGSRLVLGERIEFAKNSDRVPDEAIPQLEQLSQLLQRYPSLRLRIEVHTDTKGSAELNLSLSRRRAEKLRQRLLELSPSAENRVEALGRGESVPLMTDDSEAAHTTNRRVEVLVVP
ncbi:MAG: OmpA family protein [Myxococcota bacterium]